MKTCIKIFLFAVLLAGIVFTAGCTQNNSKYCSERFPGTVYNPSTNECDHVETPTVAPTQVTARPTTLAPTPTPAPTLNKNSVAYLNYQEDLREITDIQTDLAVLQSNYASEMAAANPRDVEWVRALTKEYNKLKAADEIRLNAAQARAAADLAEYEGG
jgi:hypothetical protein